MPAAIPVGAAVAGAAASSLLNKNKGGGTTTSVQSSDPWQGAQPYLLNLYNQAHNSFYNPKDQSPETLQALEMQAQRARSGSPLVQGAQSQLGQTINGDYLNADSNPYLKGTVDRALGDVQTRVNSQFRGNNYGGTAHQETLGRTLADAALPIYAQNYQQERGRQFGGLGLAPTLANQDYSDIGQLSSVGAAKDAAADPWQDIFNFQRAITGSGGGTTTSQQPYFTNPGATAFGGALGGLGLYNAMGGQGLLSSNPYNQNYTSNGNFNPYYSGTGSQGDYQYG